MYACIHLAIRLGFVITPLSLIIAYFLCIITPQFPHLPVDSQFSLANPTIEMVQEITQPKMFVGTLKPYQLRGINWLVNLYSQVGKLLHVDYIYI